jgi:NodT family efflux transporter outer membrane factor (OMF) lipoprotein
MIPMLSFQGKIMSNHRSRGDLYTGASCRKIHLFLLLAAFALVLGGCMVGPDYTRKEPEAPEQWHAELQGGLTAAQMDPAILARWWGVLEDPLLSSLENRAISGNLDLKEARARIVEARALRGIERAGLFPALDAGAAAGRSRSSESSGTGNEGNLYSVGFDAGWELDVFGGTRRAVEAAQASLEATREDLHAVMVSLLAEVALNYLEVRTFQTRLEASKANIRAQQETYDLNFSRYRAGLISELTVQESLRILASSSAQIPVLETGMAAALNRLAVLLGESPGALHGELAREQPIPALPASLAVGIPAEALRSRPDIRRAERNLAAQTARIGVATAELYPKFRLSGMLGLEAVTSGDLFQSGSRTWALGSGATWNVFDTGAIRQNIQVQNARQEQALIQYETTVLRALEEVENALVAYAKEQTRREALRQASAAAAKAEQLARDQYQAGLVGYYSILDAQRALFVLKDTQAQSDGAVAANLVRLYKALGGGWQQAAITEEQ